MNSGKRAADEGRDAKYPHIDFCRDPEAICSSEEHQELKWIAGFFYWVESVQTYDEGGWNYLDELRKFVDGGMQGEHPAGCFSPWIHRSWTMNCQCVQIRPFIAHRDNLLADRKRYCATSSCTGQVIVHADNQDKRRARQWSNEWFTPTMNHLRALERQAFVPRG